MPQDTWVQHHEKSSSTATAASVVRDDLASLIRRLGPEFGALAGNRLLITGGAGFLGYYLVQGVVRWNVQASPDDLIDLTVYDNGARGIPDWLASIEAAPWFRLVGHDMTRPLPDDAGPFDYIVHAAGIASPTFYRRYPLETMDANIVGLRSLLELGRRQADLGRPLRGFLFYSSSEIYGDPPPDQIPTPETYRGNVSCTGPRACYDESKRYGETLCVVFARQYGLPVRIARPFNNYGPGLRITDGRVIPDFARTMLAGRDIVMHSDGSPTRTFCYSTDAVTGYYKVLVRGAPGEAYNIGVEAPEISMKELAERVRDLGRELFGYTGEILLQPSQEAEYLVDNPQRRCPVITKARTELGYVPEVTLDEGLRRSLVWYGGHREGTS